MEFKYVKLKDVCTVNQGLQIPISKRFKEKGKNRYFYITIQFLKGNTEEYYIENPKESVICKKEDILVVRTGSTGLVLTNVEGCFHNNFFKVVPNDKIYNKYLYYCLNNEKMYKKMLNVASGTTIPDLKHSSFYNLEIPLPDYNKQIKIAKIIEDIDKKININTHINDNLYALGDTLYKEFYSRYENELPMGYKVVNLNEVSINYDSKRKPMSSREREQHRGIYPYYGATSIIDYVDDYIFDDVYLLMGEDGTVKTNEGYPVLQYIWGKNWINNHAHVLQGTKISTEHLMFALRKKNIESLITGAVQPKINQENMNKIKIIIATDEINKKFDKEIKDIVAKIKSNTIENKKLSLIRDTLLPKLMNGEIDLDKIKI